EVAPAVLPDDQVAVAHGVVRAHPEQHDGIASRRLQHAAHELVGDRAHRGQSSPAALRSAALMRSCQPGPSSWKWDSTSRSSLSATVSLPVGTTCSLGGSGAALVVAALNRASALSIELMTRRGGWAIRVLRKDRSRA